ncbi:MAG: hypothetical protein HYZ57_15185 [Acidobacteria bacterium]|nr:hypothetical protein [Acidobacteriota bacterium]
MRRASVFALAVLFAAGALRVYSDTQSSKPPGNPRATNPRVRTPNLQPGNGEPRPQPAAGPEQPPAGRARPGAVEIPGDALTRAMKDEIDRARGLMILQAPYFVEYVVDDAQSFSVSASLGALLSSSSNRFRLPRLRVRVGDYKFDNSNYVFSDFFTGSRFDPDQMPLDDDYEALRHHLWLATDRAYKTAMEAIARKKAALKNVTVSDTLPDFWPAERVERITKAPIEAIDQALWTKRVKALSLIFEAYPEVLSSGVAFEAVQAVRNLLNTEGSRVRVADHLFQVQVRATGLASDGMEVRDAEVLEALDVSGLPGEAALQRAVQEVAGNVRALAAAPAAETYAGPILFEGPASAQMFAELLGTNLILHRRPVSEPGRPVPTPVSDLEGRIGARILPEFMDVIDDPAQTSWNRIPLVGHYDVDEEGVIPKPLTLVEKGRLKAFLLTRQPVKGFEGSNGRARLPGAFGARTAMYSNLFIRASETTSEQELRKKLIELCAQRNKPYGIIVRKMDYPSSGSFADLRRLSAAAARSGTRPVSTPLLVYRIYPDGREELVRGLRFRGFSVRSLKDILAASTESHAFHFLQNLAPFAIMGGASYVAPASVIAPSVLFEDLELEQGRDDLPKPPIVPPPALAAAR